MQQNEPTANVIPARAHRILTQEHAVLLFIVAAAAALRVWHLAWSLPEVYEEAYPFAIAWKFWRWGEPGISLSPDFFHYPALTFYVQFALQALHYGAGHLFGAYNDLQAFHDAYQHDPTIFIVLGRGASVAFDLGSVLLLYASASRWFGKTAGLVAALAVALNPLFIMESQLVNVDSALAFFALLAFYWMTRLSDAPALRWYVLSGAAIGLAASSKYNGALLAVPLVLAHFWRKEEPAEPDRSFIPLLAALGAAAALFIVLNPFIVLQPQRFLEDFTYEQRHMATGHLGLDAGRSSLLYYLLEALPRFLGWPFLCACAGAAVLGIAARNRRIGMVALFPALYLAVIGSWEMRAERYILPLMPFLILLGAVAIAEAWTRLAARASALRTTPGRWLMMGALLAIALAAPVAGAIEYHRTIALPDTRTQAKEWIIRNLPERSALVTGPFGIRLPQEKYAVALIPFSPTGSEALAPFYDPRWYEDAECLIASDYDYGRFALEPGRYAAILAQYARLRSEWSPAAEFAPGPERSGPALWLYRPPANVPGRFDESLFRALSAVAETALVLQFTENLATMLFEKRKTEKCAQLAEAFLSLAPSETRLVNSFAWTLFREKRYAEALAMADRSLRAESRQASMATVRGSALLRMGKDIEAETELLRAITLDRTMEIPYLDLELIYRMRNDTARRREILRGYLAILPAGSENALRTEAVLRQLEAR